MNEEDFVRILHRALRPDWVRVFLKTTFSLWTILFWFTAGWYVAKWLHG